MINFLLETGAQSVSLAGLDFSRALLLGLKVVPLCKALFYFLEDNLNIVFTTFIHR